MLDGTWLVIRAGTSTISLSQVASTTPRATRISCYVLGCLVSRVGFGVRGTGWVVGRGGCLVLGLLELLPPLYI